MTVKSIKIFSSKIIKNNKGNLIKYVSSYDKFYEGFGEIYFNEIKINKKKGWTKHKRNSCLIKCIFGKVKFHLIDKKDKELKIIISSKQNKILKIPPNIWFCFESLVSKSIIANLIKRPHDDKEVSKSKSVKNYQIR